MINLSIEEQGYLKERMRISYGIVQDFEINRASYFSDKKIKKITSTCFCNKSKGKTFDSLTCPYCHKPVTIIYPKDTGETNNKFTEKKVFYVRPIATGIQVICLQIVSNLISSSETIPKLKFNIIQYINIEIGKKASAFRVKRGMDEPMDVFDALNINTQTIRDGISVIYKDSDNIIDFMLKNKEFAKKTGYINFFNDVDLKAQRDIVFFIYLYVLTEYPAIELIVKMKYTKLVEQIFLEIMRENNKESIRAKGNKISELVKDTTKGSLALTLPKFAANYLNDVEANIDEYRLWSIVFSYETLTSEEFNRIYQSLALPYYRTYNVIKCLKYGYKLKNLISYLEKESESTAEMDNLSMLLYDYLEMSSQMGIKPDLYPHNIKTAHDNTMIAYNAKKNEIQDIVLNKISKNCQKYIPENNDYMITIPSTSNEFLIEGREQHNCVASYISRVIEGTCIIFFIRKKDSPEISFITAEYSNGGLAQIKQKFNNSVYNKEILDYAKKFCEKISKNEKHIYEKEV